MQSWREVQVAVGKRNQQILQIINDRLR